MIPDWAMMWILVIFLLLLSTGAVIGAIYFGWWANAQVQLLDKLQRAEEARFEARAEHDIKLLELQYVQAKAVNDQSIAAQTAFSVPPSTPG